MTASQQINTRRGLKLLVEKIETETQIEVSLRAQDITPENARARSIDEYLLHWGLRHESRQKWEIPPTVLWPEGTRAVGQAAVQTPFAGKNGQSQIVIRLARP